MPQPTLSLKGVEIFKGWLDPSGQEALLRDVRSVVARAPLFSPCTPRGKPMSVRMTAAGRYGWYSDRSGYRYRAEHPEGMPWPQLPERILALSRALISDSRDPECCLINFYGEGARMGLHQDRDEADFTWPVLSVSLGDEALFRVGNTTRGGPTGSHWLQSGDVLRIGGDARLAYHGVDRIRFGSSRLLPKGGRINLTLRVVE